jgi:copper oxidase (laccase) domain-containing protein
MDAMTQAFGTEPAQCTAVIGPGISQESFEVGQEVLDRFTGAGFKMDDVTIWLPNTKKDELPREKPHIDLKEVNRRQLLAKGVEAQKIAVSSVDTYTDERYFSARREQTEDVKCGRILTGFMLKRRL